MNPESILDKMIRNIPLNEEELRWWEENQNKSEVQGDFEFLDALRAPLANENKTLLKSQLQSFEKSKHQLKEKKSSRVINMRTWMAIAASLLVLVTAIFVLRNPQGDGMFDQYYEPYPSIVSPIVKGEQNATTQMDEIMQHYQNENYQQVDNLIDQLSKPNDTLLFYRANALLELNQTNEAKDIFTELQNRSNRFSREAQWYEILSLLKLKQTDQALSKLQTIIQNEQHPYYQEAVELLRTIK